MRHLGSQPSASASQKIKTRIDPTQLRDWTNHLPSKLLQPPDGSWLLVRATRTSTDSDPSIPNCTQRGVTAHRAFRSLSTELHTQISQRTFRLDQPSPTRKTRYRASFSRSGYIPKVNRSSSLKHRRGGCVHILP